MKKPFGFMDAYYRQEKLLRQGVSKDPEKRMEEVRTRAFVMEEQAKEQFDKVANVIAEKIGVKEIPWLKCTLYFTFFYAIITVLVMFFRPDFVNVYISFTHFYFS